MVVWWNTLLHYCKFSSSPQSLLNTNTSITTRLHSWAAYIAVIGLLQPRVYATMYSVCASLSLSLSHLCNPPGICTWLLYMKFGYKTNDLIANLATMFLSLREPLIQYAHTFTELAYSVVIVKRDIVHLFYRTISIVQSVQMGIKIDGSLS